jgi:hypothetical protein
VAAIAIVFYLVYYHLPTSVTVVVGLVTAIVVTVHLRWEYTYSIEINTGDKLITIVSKSRTNTVTDKVAFDEVHFTYKKRFDYYGGIKNRYGRKDPRSILQLECKQKTLAYLVPHQDGWTDAMILSLAKDLAVARVKQVVEKDNEAEIPINISSIL